MKTYELIIEKKQPTCGGRAPTNSEIKVVTINDPLEYVKTLETSKEIKVYTNDYGATVVHVERGGLWVNYEFSEM